MWEMWMPSLFGLIWEISIRRRVANLDIRNLIVLVCYSVALLLCFCCYIDTLKLPYREWSLFRLICEMVIFC
jgi:hypothetical protein